VDQMLSESVSWSHSRRTHVCRKSQQQ
jgi:hypothetical protein